MKSSDFLRSFLVASALTGLAARGADPQPAPASPDIQALVKLLNKMVEELAAENPSPAETEPAPAAKAAAPAGWQPRSTVLQTGHLSTSGLTAAASLEGHGANALVRLTEEAWRLLFPLKQPGN